MTTRHALALTLALAHLPGCLPHVTVPRAPPRAAPLTERAGLYNTWRPLVMSSTVHYQRDTGMVTAQSTDSVTLANGAVVAYPEDLLPLVDDPSPYAESARRASRLSTRGAAVVLAGVGVAVLGGVIFGVAASRDGGPFDDDNRTLTLAGLGVAGGGALVAVIGGAVFGPASNQARREAFLGFDAALRARMNLCGDVRLTDCAAPPR